MNKIISFLIARARVVFYAAFGCALALAFFSKDVAIEAKSTSFFLADDPDLQAFFQTERDFGEQDFLVYALKFKKSAFDSEAIEVLREIKGVVEGLSGGGGANGATAQNSSQNSSQNSPQIPAVQTLSILNAPLFMSHAPSIEQGADLALARDEILNNPIYAKNLISTDASTVSLLIYGASAAQMQAILPRLEAIAARSDAVQTQVLGGMSVIVEHMISYIKSDLATYGVALVVLLSIAVWVFFGSFFYVFACLFICVLSLLASLGFFALSGYAITVISSNYVPLVLIITISVIIHLLAHFAEISARKSDRRLLVRHTLLAKAKPSFYAILTTVVGFLSLVFSGIVPISELGSMMSIGIVMSLLLAYLLMPNLLLHAPAGQNRQVGARLLRFAAGCALRRRRLIYALSACAIALCAAAIPRLQAENSFANYFLDKSDVKRGLVLIDDKLGGTLPLDVLLSWESAASGEGAASGENAASEIPPGGQMAVTSNFSSAETAADYAVNGEKTTQPPGGRTAVTSNFSSATATTATTATATTAATVTAATTAADADEDDDFGDFLSDYSASEYFLTSAKLAELARVHHFIEQLPHVGSALSIASLAEFAAKALPGAADTMGLNLALAALGEQTKQQIVYPYYNEGKKQLRIAVRMKDSDRELRRAELIATLKRELPKLTSAQVQVSGVMVLYNNMLSSLVHSQVDTLSFVVGSIFALFLIIFRNLRFSVIGIIANVVPLSALFSIIAFGGLKLDLMSITIAAISIGIGVDDIIHYVHRFREEIKRRPLEEAIVATHASVGSALFYTTTTVVLGFMLMMCSSFTPTIYFGLLTVLVMILLLCGSLFLLPSLIISWHGSGYFRAEFKPSAEQNCSTNCAASEAEKSC